MIEPRLHLYQQELCERKALVNLRFFTQYINDAIREVHEKHAGALVVYLEKYVDIVFCYYAFIKASVKFLPSNVFAFP
jgi:hypothetical protein